MSTNEDERRRWNDERRYRAWPKRERLTDAVTGLLLAALAPQPGERILDIGSGGGRAALAAGAVVGPAGAVVGADISEGLTRLARERATAAGADNVSFAVVDAQTAEVPGAPFDAAMSQFGVMFFDDPDAAFANIRRQLRPGGRLAFACWLSVDENSWFAGRALAEFLPPAPPIPSGTIPPGPFAFADPVRTAGILERAGFTAVRVAPHRLEVAAPEDAVIDDDQLVFMGISEDERPAAKRHVDAYMERFRGDDGLSRFPLAFQIVTAGGS